MIVAVDAMGGDKGYQSVVPAALAALKAESRLKLILVGQLDILLPLVKDSPFFHDKRLMLHEASEVVGMDEAPASALKNKKDSSMRVAINLVKQGVAEACVSAGNTGALMATARFVLRMLPGIDRPAICTAIPTTTGQIYMLDLGANVDSSAEHLYQFAVMGTVFAQAVSGIASPTVGLLNIGEEAIKGNEQVKAAAVLLQNSELNYIGFVEGHDVFLKPIDVVVCDGFVGNVALKTMEGASKLIAYFMEQEFKRNPLTKLAGLIALPVIKGLKRRADPRQYNGASLLGLQGIVVKSHGNADAFAFQRAITIAMRQVEQDSVKCMQQHFKTTANENNELFS